VKVSQNGWPVVGQDKVTDRAVYGVEFPNGWLKGDVDVVFTHLIGRLHKEVEKLDDGGCWGWFVKNIEGSKTISNHASGTAIDYNAPAHPMGVRNTYSAPKRAKIHAILKDLDHVVRWGGDYSGRPDDMHFEIHDTAGAVRAVARKIKAKEAEEAKEEDDVSKADVIAALDETRPYKLARIKERGWADISLSTKIDYIFESLVANGMIAADPDGVVDDSASVQARLARIEAALGRLEAPGTPGA
jgi:D-alanyl-D-alanine carboxypeptidase